MPNHLFPPSIETISGQKVKRYWILLKTKAKNWPFALKMLTLLAQVGTTNAAGVVLVAAETVETVIQTSRLSSQQPQAALKLGDAVPD